MASPAIELRKVSLKFGKDVLLKEINVTLSHGQALVLIGPSGQGKSVVLKLIAGLMEPTAGDVLIEGRSWREMRGSERDSTLRKMGMLFQKNALFDSLSVGENIAFPLREVTGATEQEIEATVAKYLEAVGLSAARDRFPDEISGGMQKRLGIARALALRPQIVLYDDPTAGLDPITSRKIARLIKDLQIELHTTLVAVTNDMNRAYQIADQIGMVVDGELILCGTPEETHRHPDPRVQQFIRGRLEGPLMVHA